MGGPDADETLRPGAGEAGEQRFAVGSLAADRYRVRRFIASGGMGEVYAAHDLVLDITVALKTLRPELEGSSTAIARLRREIALARSVTNPHICRLHDVGEHDGRVFLTMELLEGRTLAEIVSGGALAIAEVERIAEQLVDGLAALHRASIIHRDFKTSNVIVVGTGSTARAVITDFGLARSIESTDALLTIESSLLGTPAYMAPEQVEARPTSTASDIYSLGVVLFELLTGTLPFREDTAMATATARLHRDPPRPSSMRAGIPSRWDQIVLRCLAREPGDRFARVEDVLAAAPRSRRWFLAAGGTGVAAAALGVWRARGCVEPGTVAAFAKDDLVAVLPTQGDGLWHADPWSLAFTIDLHDALSTAAVPALAINGQGQEPGLRGTAVRLMDEPDPIASAFAFPEVAAVVQTSIVSRTSDRVELELVGTGSSVDGWRQRFSRPLAECALLVSDVAAAIAAKLGFPAPRAPRDSVLLTPQVYERYGRALVDLYRKRTPEERAAAEAGTLAWKREKQLEYLVAEAPSLVRATVPLAGIYKNIGEQKETAAETNELLDRASTLLDRALEIDPECARALAHRGYIAMLRWNWQLADDETRLALELAPTHESVSATRHFYLMLVSRFDEGVAEAERSHRRSPNQRLGEAWLGWHYYYARRFPDVVRVVEPILAKFDLTNIFEAILAGCLAQSYAEMARFDEAFALAERMRSSPGIDHYALSPLVGVYVMAGRVEEARALQTRIADKTDLAAIAAMADALGDLELALKTLEQVVASHNIHAMFLKMERYTPQLRSHPRFQALLKAVGLV